MRVAAHGCVISPIVSPHVLYNLFASPRPASIPACQSSAGHTKLSAAAPIHHFPHDEQLMATFLAAAGDPLTCLRTEPASVWGQPFHLLRRLAHNSSAATAPPSRRAWLLIEDNVMSGMNIIMSKQMNRWANNHPRSQWPLAQSCVSPPRRRRHSPLPPLPSPPAWPCFISLPSGRLRITGLRPCCGRAEIIRYIYRLNTSDNRTDFPWDYSLTSLNS